MDDELKDRIEALEARDEISRLIARYGPAVDDHDFDTLAELYTSDAVFDSPGGRMIGRDRVMDYYRERAGAYGATYHYPHSQEIYLDGPADGRGVICAHAELAIDGDTHIVAVRYHDIYRRELGAWRFHIRDVHLLYVLSVDQLATGLAEADRVRWPGRPRALAALGSDL
jgi:ketosteroid isomerase-like protein